MNAAAGTIAAETVPVQPRAVLGDDQETVPGRRVLFLFALCAKSTEATGARARELQPAQYGRHRIPRVFQHDGGE